MADRIPVRRLLAFAALGVLAWLAVSVSDWPNTPGAPATADGVAISGTSARPDGDTLHVQLALVSESEGPLRAWFFLAAPGDQEPWERFEYQSVVHEMHVLAGEPIVLEWAEQPRIRDGRYEVTAWVHRLEDGEWVHAAGGPYEFGEITISQAGVRFREQFGGGAARFQAPTARPQHVLLPITLPAEGPPVTVTWEWRDHATAAIVASGGRLEVQKSGQLELPWPEAEIPATGFDLIVTARAAGGERPAQMAHAYGLEPPR